MISVSWVITSRKGGLALFIWHAFLFALVIALCLAWMALYSEGMKTKAFSVFVMLLFPLFVVIPSVMSLSPVGGSLLMPLVAWAVLQLCVSAREFECV